MRFQVPSRYLGLRAVDIRAVSSYLEEAPGNFLLIGDNSILHGLTGKPSMFPALYLVGGLTIPARGTAELGGFERMIFDRLAQEDVRRIVLERRTWERVSIASFPRLRALVDRCRGTSRAIGFFQVIELSDGRGCAWARGD